MVRVNMKGVLGIDELNWRIGGSGGEKKSCGMWVGEGTLRGSFEEKDCERA